jgi:hypothetical protein
VETYPIKSPVKEETKVKREKVMERQNEQTASPRRVEI